ncbi:MAG TPA: CDP-alcohol phosphatidyltransferase family protein [Chitinivibrionales bacterium]|nr:CDP-alcohol phosphatidyltransferase family protein [Chitinivibrionales bacterium]
MKPFNLAIALTLSRIVIAPFFAFFFIRSFHAASPVVGLWISAGLAALIELSDAFDGRMARARNQVSDFGKLLDPMADSLSRQTIFLSFMVCADRIIPLWMFLLFLYRDAVLSILRMMCAYHGKVLAARQMGKLKAVVQAVGAFTVLALCLGAAYHVPWIPLVVWGRHPGFWVMCVPAAVTVFSIYDYIASNWDVVKVMAVSQFFK